VAPPRIILDLDATDDPLHGQQEGRFFHGYYGHYCYLPLYIFCGEFLLWAELRRSDIDASAGLIAHNARLPCFEITADSKRVLDDLALAARIQAVLIEDFPSVKVAVKNGMAFVSIESNPRQQEKQVGQVSSIVRDIDGVEGVRVHFVPFVLAD
jgi:hypothetical protein